MYNSMKLIEMAGSWNDLTKFKGPVSYRSCFKSSCLKVDPTLPILVPWICLESHPHLSIFADLCVSVQYKPVSEIEDTIEQDNTGCVCWPYAWKPNVTHLARFYTITQSAIKAVGWHGTANPRQNCPELQKVHQVLQPLEQGWTLVLLFQLKQNWMQNGKAWERNEKGWKGMEIMLESRFITAFATMRSATTGSTRRSGCLGRGPRWISGLRHVKTLSTHGQRYARQASCCIHLFSHSNIKLSESGFISPHSV